MKILIDLKQSTILTEDEFMFNFVESIGYKFSSTALLEVLQRYFLKEKAIRTRSTL
jgi:hypothetical protein